MSKMPMKVSASSMLAPNLALMRDISQSNTLLYASLATESLAAFASSSVLKANVLAILVLVRLSAEKDHQFSPNCCVSKHRALREYSAPLSFSGAMPNNTAALWRDGSLALVTSHGSEPSNSALPKCKMPANTCTSTRSLTTRLASVLDGPLSFEVAARCYCRPSASLPSQHLSTLVHHRDCANTANDQNDTEITSTARSATS